MSVKIRPYRRSHREGWEVDIRVELPDGREIRERRRSPVSGRSATERWARDRETHLIRVGLPDPNNSQSEKKEVPTLEDFAPRFAETYLTGEGRKPSVVHTNESLLRVHLLPALGKKRLDQITTSDVAELKRALTERGLGGKSVNNVLSVLRCLLNVAKDWGEIDAVTCRVKGVRAPEPEMGFLDFAEYERLLDAAKQVDTRAYLSVLLGGKAGLRCGEIIALRIGDVDLKKGELHVRQSCWKGRAGLPKGGRRRTVPLSNVLKTALKAARHLRGEYVLCHDDGSPLSDDVVRSSVYRAIRKAGLAKFGTHLLRHTFCSHLAMRGASARAIQLLAGHADIRTTMRYMHLSPAAKESAIRLLDEPIPAFARGEILEQPEPESRNLLN